MCLFSLQFVDFNLWSPQGPCARKSSKNIRNFDPCNRLYIFKRTPRVHYSISDASGSKAFISNMLYPWYWDEGLLHWSWSIFSYWSLKDENLWKCLLVFIVKFVFISNRKQKCSSHFLSYVNFMTRNFSLSYKYMKHNET